jgi:predicted ester cyclase
MTLTGRERQPCARPTMPPRSRVIAPPLPARQSPRPPPAAEARGRGSAIPFGFAGLGPGKAGMRQLFEMFHSAFDWAGLEVDDMIAEGDKVFVLARMTGTQRGEFMGVAATGNTIDVSACDYFRVGHGALIEHWGVMDAAGMMQQLTAH